MSIDFIGSLPENLTQELLVGKLLVGGLGVKQHLDDHVGAELETSRVNIKVAEPSL